MNTNKTIVDKVRQIAGAELAEKLQTAIDKKFEKGKIAIKAVIDGKDLATASEISGMPQAEIRNIIYNLNRKGNWKDIRYKRLLPTRRNGQADISLLPIKIKSGAR